MVLAPIEAYIIKTFRHFMETGTR